MPSSGPVLPAPLLPFSFILIHTVSSLALIEKESTRDMTCDTDSRDSAFPYGDSALSYNYTKDRLRVFWESGGFQFQSDFHLPHRPNSALTDGDAFHEVFVLGRLDRIFPWKRRNSFSFVRETKQI